MESKANARSWIIWGLATIFYLYELVLRVSPSVMTNDLMETFNATSTVLGILVSFYYYSYTILQLPCGIILDKLGPRNLVGVSAVLCIIGALLFASSDKIYIAQIGRFLIGAGSACAFVSCLQIAANSFPKKYFVILVGITNMMGTFGGLLGGFPIARSVNSIGWRSTTFVLSAIGFVIAVLIFAIIPKTQKKQEQENRSGESAISSVIALLKNNQVVLPSVISGLMYLTISVFAELWIVPFFMAKFEINNETASLASAVIFIGVAVGSIALAIFARRIKSYVKTIKFSAILTALSFLLLIFVSDNLYSSFVIVFVIGFLTGAQAINFTCAKNNAPEVPGTTVALSNCIVMLIGAIFQPLIGVLLDFFWTGIIGENGLRVYDAVCYRNAIIVIPASLVVAYLLSFFLKETIHLEHD
ncbi:MAG: MFS transporter [Holosporales bacterium]|jgi:predicted MFS family arabinose efflux permease|nr:MFS transporter [Holosporales bacterium]